MSTERLRTQSQQSICCERISIAEPRPRLKRGNAAVTQKERITQSLAAGTAGPETRVRAMPQQI